MSQNDLGESFHLTTLPDAPPMRAIIFGLVATAATMLVLDLAWLGLIATDLYDLLGPLKSKEVYWPAAALFYAFYVTTTLSYAVLGASSPGDAARRGAALGFVAYTTYELTNWAVLAGWPALLVPIDIVWGIVLTGTASAVGRLAFKRADNR